MPDAPLRGLRQQQGRADGERDCHGDADGAVEEKATKTACPMIAEIQSFCPIMAAGPRLTYC